MSQKKKYLQQRFTDKGFARIFDWTELLSQRADMYPYDGPVPPDRIVKIGTAEATPTDTPKPMMHFDSKKIIAPEDVVPPAEPEHKDEGPAEIADLDTEHAPSPDDDVPAPQPAAPQLEGEAKIAKLCEIIKAFPQDEKHYTTAGLPRLDMMIMALGGQDVRSDERKAAMEKLGIKK